MMYTQRYSCSASYANYTTAILSLVSMLGSA